VTDLNAAYPKWMKGLRARLRDTPYCGRCDSCGDAGCRCGRVCDRGLFCMYPGIKEETEEAIREGWAAIEGGGSIPPHAS
jgi:hypothetical protein